MYARYIRENARTFHFQLDRGHYWTSASRQSVWSQEGKIDTRRYQPRSRKRDYLLKAVERREQEVLSARNLECEKCLQFSQVEEHLPGTICARRTGISEKHGQDLLGELATSL